MSCLDSIGANEAHLCELWTGPGPTAVRAGGGGLRPSAGGGGGGGHLPQRGPSPPAAPAACKPSPVPFTAAKNGPIVAGRSGCFWGKTYSSSTSEGKTGLLLPGGRSASLLF